MAGRNGLKMPDRDAVVTAREHGGDRLPVPAQNGARDPEALVTQIEQARENLARTIDALAERVSPAYNAQRLLARAKEQAARPELRIAAGAVATIVLASAAFGILRRRRK